MSETPEPTAPQGHAPDAPDAPDAPAPFERFEEAVRESLTVPKSELSRRMAEAKAERAKARANKDKPLTPAPRRSPTPRRTASSDRG